MKHVELDRPEADRPEAGRLEADRLEADRLEADRLEAKDCRDDEALRAFVQKRISVNAWPIHSRPLRRLIRLRGLDLAAAAGFETSVAEMEALMRRIHAGSRRAERMLGIDNAFHHTIHNFDVALRLLLLEWPDEHPVADEMAAAAAEAYVSFDVILPVLLELIRRLLELGVPSAALARDVLAAAGHDYGHTGGTDRRSANGDLAPLTHEEVAEKHTARFGIDAGMPPALILESMAAIRATTLHTRPGRDKIAAGSDFERRMMLADVSGCVKRPDLWMTRVAIPVVYERLEPWKRRVMELPREIRRLRQRLESLAVDDAGREEMSERLSKLEAENDAIIKTVSGAIDSELRFLTFIRDYRLAPVPSGRRLWSRAIDDRIALVTRQLARKDLLEPLDARGFPLVVEMAGKLANAESMERTLRSDGIPLALRELYREFLPGSATG